jgi:nicotinamidase-related amidase
MRLRREDSFLLVVDVQQKLAPHVLHHQDLIRRAEGLIRCATLLEIPVLLSEHSPENIGPTVPSLAALASPKQIVKKTHFACTDQPACLEAFRSLKKKQVLVAGMEAHVCVMQTVLGLLERGFQPFVVEDAVGSRKEEDRTAALERMRAAGCAMATTEMAMFEWMENADVPEFRDVLKLVKGL